MFLLYRGKRGSKYEVELKDDAPVIREKRFIGDTFCSTQEGIWAISQNKILFYAFRNNVILKQIYLILFIILLLYLFLLEPYYPTNNRCCNRHEFIQPKRQARLL